MQPSLNQRAAVNRANARHSTGPRTDHGKHRSSLNALRHGLTAHTLVLPSEDPEAYRNHVQRYFADCAPRGEIETQLVQTLADTAWRMNRVVALETNLLTTGMIAHAADHPTTDSETTNSLSIAASLTSQSRALATISQHEQRLSRQFHSTIARLREIQNERIQRELRELRCAAAVSETYKHKGLPYDPAEDGFVLTKQEIEAHIAHMNRLNQSRYMQWFLENGPGTPLQPKATG